MATNENFTVKNGLVVPTDATVNGNVVMANTSNISIGTTGVVINQNLVFARAAILASQSNSMNSDVALTAVNQTIMQLTFTMPALSTSNYRVIIDWNVQVDFPATGTRILAAELADGSVNFGYRLVESGGGQTGQGCGGFSISPSYAANATKTFSLLMNISSTLASTFAKAVTQTYMNGYIISSS